MEKPTGELLFNFTYIVTTLELSPEDIIRIYCNRGKMENFIKEAKNGFACQKMSSTHFQANEVKLQMCMLAYNFNNWFRRLCLSVFQKRYNPAEWKPFGLTLLKLRLNSFDPEDIGLGSYAAPACTRMRLNKPLRISDECRNWNEGWHQIQKSKNQ